MLEGVQLAIPIFHVYGHQAKCHVSNHLKFVNGLSEPYTFVVVVEE